MRVAYADAGYRIALWNSRDPLHQRLLAVAGTLAAAAVVTTQIVRLSS